MLQLWVLESSIAFAICTGLLGAHNLKFPIYFPITMALFNIIFYRRFIAPWLFGRKKEKSIQETVDEMNNNLTRLVSEVSTTVQHMSVTVASLRANQREKSEMKELKSEVASLKALLLGRYKFRFFGLCSGIQ